MPKPAQNIEPAELPETRWEANPDNLNFRLDRAISLANEHLQGYTDEDIQFIWEIIKTPLFSENEHTYKALGETHPPVDRLFDIAFDTNGYTNSIIEGEIDPAVICAVYALKTAEYARERDSDLVAAALICIDAWRALTFIPRARYLHEKFRVQYSRNLKGREGRQGAKHSREDYEYLTELVTETYEEKSEDFRHQESSKKYHPSDSTNKENINGKKFKFGAEYIALEINHLLVKRNKIIEGELSTDQIIRMLKNHKKNKIEQNLIADIKTKGIPLTYGPLRWPNKPTVSENEKDENFTGETKEVVTGNHEKFKKLIRKRVEELKYWNLIEYLEP